MHEAKRRKKAGKLRSYTDKSSCPRRQLQPGQHVITQHLKTRRWKQRAVILESRAIWQSYIIRINEQCYLQRQRFLPPNPEPNQTSYTRLRHHRRPSSRRLQHHGRLSLRCPQGNEKLLGNQRKKKNHNRKRQDQRRSDRNRQNYISDIDNYCIIHLRGHP